MNNNLLNTDGNSHYYDPIVGVVENVTLTPTGFLTLTIRVVQKLVQPESQNNVMQYQINLQNTFEARAFYRSLRIYEQPAGCLDLTGLVGLCVLLVWSVYFHANGTKSGELVALTVIDHLINVANDDSGQQEEGEA